MDRPRIPRPIRKKIDPEQRIARDRSERHPTILVLAPKQRGFFHLVLASSPLRLDEREVRLAARAVVPEHGEEADGPVERARGAVEGRSRHPPPVVVQAVLLARLVPH